MKKLKSVFIFSLAVALLTSSCEDAYNIEQPGEVNEESLKTVSDLQSYLNAAVYASLDLTSEIGFTGIVTDETGVGKSNGLSDLDTHRWQLNSDNGYSFGIWWGKYNTINRVNRTIRIANKIGVPTDPTQLAQYNSILAEARAIRAFAYLDLLTYFSPDMTNDNATGVMYLGDDVPGVDDMYARSTNGVIFTAIEADLNFAYANVASSNDYKHVTKLMIDALRARMYLYRGNHTLAKQYAQSVISTSGLTLALATPVPSPAPTNPNYSVIVASNPLTVGAPTAAWNTAFYNYNSTSAVTPYRRMFADLPTGNSRYEIIFALDRPTSGTWGNIAAAFTQNTTTANGSPRWEVSRFSFQYFKRCSWRC
ncbi:MAG: RagB/SusD family nutrient uptake outer membrane protein [Flavobacterium sp.]